jgi:hypothetical protein
MRSSRSRYIRAIPNPAIGDIVMKRAVVLNLVEGPVRFTHDGRVSVLDAIRAVSMADDSDAIWKKLKKEHPEILLHCTNESVGKDGSVMVVNSEGWEMIWLLLPEYLLDPDLMQSTEKEENNRAVASG